VQRVVSRYYHFRRNYLTTGNYNSLIIPNPELSLLEFAQIKQWQNTYAKFLFGMSLSDFEFVGITEHFDLSIELYNQKFNSILPVTSVKANTNPEKRTKEYELSDRTRLLISENNSKDIEIYNDALRTFKKNVSIGLQSVINI